MSAFDGYRIPGFTTQDWGAGVRAATRQSALDVIARGPNNLAASYARTAFQDLAKPWITNPVLADSIRGAIRPEWTGQIKSYSTAALLHSFHRDLLSTYTRLDVGAKLSLPPQDLGAKITPALPAVDFLRTSSSQVSPVGPYQGSTTQSDRS